MNPINIQYFVKLILPYMLGRLCSFILIRTNIKGYLLISNFQGKILLTHSSIYPLEAYHEAKPNKQAKGKILTRPWGIKSPSRTHSRRTLSSERILRPARSTSGPLRDDTTSSCRQDHCHRDLKAVRRQPCDLLSSRWNVRPSRPHRSNPTKTGTEEPAQVYARDYRIHQAATFTATRCNPGGSHSRSIRKVRCLPSSSDHRARTCQYKKKESNQEKHASISFFKGGTTLIDQYEQLRTSMISPDGELHTPGYCKVNALTS